MGSRRFSPGYEIELANRGGGRCPDGPRGRIGQVVVSRAGRDAGRPFVVVGVAGDRFVLVADGDLRKISNPKKKNVRHLRFEPIVLDEVTAKLAAGREVLDAEIEEALKGVIHRDDQG